LFLAASVFALAGCNQSPSTETATATDTDTATETASTATPTATVEPTPSPTDTDTPTETAEPTETETPELSPREEQAAEAMDRAIRELTRAVNSYADQANGSLLDVSAASRSFTRITVLGDISDADDHISDARPRASERQRARLAGIEDARQFLRISVDVQTAVIEAYGDAQQGREALDEEQDGGIDTASGSLRDNQRRANQRLTTLTEETAAEPVSVVPALPTSEYEAKVSQFTAEVDGFASLADFFDRLEVAVVDLNDAERFDRVENESRARENAREAAEAFETLETELRTFVSNLSESGASLEGLSTDLADLAAAKAEKAREIEADNA
jgi:hypothetical protein